ncbi:hypothetical protein IAI10_11470 [Clostridium sp. 19966]|uniref:DUF7922 domain-containing protein n=1 Tax=Clostridium sp. 19966 TaxID=2768166 RepID=UPI0028DE8654|nr:hypothetical protein [Clostridium sp. 19966]MDT8717278.1 hypothetical protein [Clostridium sp. 19966]
MASKKSYSRYFIILQQDENGYSISSDKLPSGYTKLETKNDKCKVSYYVQNLKKEKEPYYMVLICSKKDVNKLIKLGEMNIDEYGRAEITYEYDVFNVAGSNISVDMITGAAVVRYNDTSMVSVMSGFATSDIPSNWRSFKVFDNQQTVISPEENKLKEEKVEVKPVKEKIEVIEKAEEKIEEVEVKKDNMFDQYEKNIEEDIHVKSDEEITEVKDLVEEVKNPEKVEKLEKVKNEVEEKLEIEDKTKNNAEQSTFFVDTDSVSKHIEKQEEAHASIGYELETPLQFFDIVAEGFEKVEEVCTDIKRCTWYKVNVNSVEDMCNSSNYNRYTLAYQPMVTYYPYIKNFGHYLFGYKHDASGNVKYIVYAVPGKRSASDQPYAGKSGFVTWVSAKEGEAREDDAGYWLMFYDYKTSTIVIPVP